MNDPVDAEKAKDMSYPTPEEINALPDKIRAYIHDLETRCDKAGDLRRLKASKRKCEELEAALADANERIEELEAEVGRLQSSLQGVRRLLYGSRSAYQKGWDRERPHHYESAVAPAIVYDDDDKTRPSSCSFRVEQIEAVAEIIETALCDKYSNLHSAPEEAEVSK